MPSPKQKREETPAAKEAAKREATEAKDYQKTRDQDQSREREMTMTAGPSAARKKK